MGTRPYSSALSEMGTHLRGMEFHLSAKNGELVGGNENYAANSMSKCVLMQFIEAYFW